MIEIKVHNKESVEHMYAAGRIAALTLDAIEQYLLDNPYRRTMDIEKLAEDIIRSYDAIPECINYKPYPGVDAYKYATCISPNDVACHGFPSNQVLCDGDIVNVDLVVRYNGWLGDTSRTFAIGNVSEENLKLMEIAKNAMYAGMRVVQKGLEFKYIGSSIAAYCRRQKIGTKGVRPLEDYCGHGISQYMHEPPHVEHVRNSCNVLIRPYLYFTIEPIIVIGDSIRTRLEADDWTVKTANGANAAQFEHTMGLDENGKLMIFTTRDRAHEEEVLEEISAMRK